MPEVQAEKPTTGNQGQRRAGKRRWNSGKSKLNVKNALYVFEKEIYGKYSQQPTYHHQKIFHADAFHAHEGLEVAIQIGDTPIIPKMDKRPGIPNFNHVIGSSIQTVRDVLKTNKIKVVAPPKETTKTVTAADTALTTLAKWATHAGNEVLAGLFKDILSHQAPRSNGKLMGHYYWTQIVEDGDSVGYTCELECSGIRYKSNGVMASELQAEQSAAEVCLRALGYLPALNTNQLSIQPYTGGSHGKNIKVAAGKPYLYTSRLASDILMAYVISVKYLGRPVYFVKPDKQDFKCVCVVDGKAFEAATMESEEAAIQLAADKAAHYLGISHPQLRMEFRKHLRMHKFDLYRRHRLLHNAWPSRLRSWTHQRFASDITYDEGKLENIEMVVKCPYFLSNLPTVEHQDKLIEDEIKQSPVFKDQPILNLTDLCVSHVHESNPNVYVIGNKDFSAKMWCKDGKIYSKDRKCPVEILPGHNIRNLQCEYRVSVPSFEVYLHAVECGDLFYPNPPNPVTTSCGVVALYHDIAASPKDIFVLLQHQTDYKEDVKQEKRVNKMEKMKILLQKLIVPDGPDCTPAEACEGMQSWEEEDLKLLSEMTMDSVQRVMTNNLKDSYDSRCNELFARPEIPEPLKEVQNLCIAELKRVEEERAEKDATSVHSWQLPESEFMDEFKDTGIYMEGSVLCGMRALVENTGVRISLGEIETSPVVEIPVEGKRIRGAQSRYYILEPQGTVGGNLGKKRGEARKKLSAEGYKQKSMMGFIHHGRRYVYQLNVPAEKMYLENVQYVNLDGTKVKPKPREPPVVETPPAEEKMEGVVEAEVEEKAADKAEEADEQTEDNAGEGEEEEPMEEEEPETSKVEDEGAQDDGSDETETAKDTEEDMEPKTSENAIDDVGDAKETEETAEPKAEEADAPSNVDPYSILDSGTVVDPTDLEDTTFETLDEYKHVEDDDVILIEDGHPVGSKKSKTEIVKEAEEKLKEEKAKEEKRKEIEAKKAAQKEYRKRLNQKRDGSLEDLPPRDVESWHCEWVVLDRALELCPQFKKVHETTIFQEHLSKFLKNIATAEK